MSYPKEYKTQGNTSIAKFSYNNNIIQFNIDSYVLSIVQDFNPKIPSKRAIFIQKGDKQERISGLFPNKKDFNTFNGDVKKKDEKKYFTIRYINENTLEHTDLIKALIFKGLLPTKRPNTPLETQITATQEQLKGGFSND